MRKVVLTRPQADRPATTVYGTPGQPLLLLFDAPLGKGMAKAPGMEIHRHPLRPNVLVVTPSKALAASRGPVPVVVALPSGPVTLSLVLKPEAPDTRVDIARSPEPSRLAQAERAKPERPETLRHLATPLAAQTMKVIVSNTAWPDSAIRCRVSLLVQTPEVPAGIPVEIRSADPTLCESTGSPSMRVDGGR